MLKEIVRSSILQFFDQNIYAHIIGDLKLLDAIQPKTHGNGCTVPTAMTIMGSLELIGFLLSTEGKLGKSEANIIAAIKYVGYCPDAYNGFCPDTYTDDCVKNISIIYRHGMMHSFYPIQKRNQIFGVHKSESKELFEKIPSNSVIITSLNVNVLSRDFKNFVDKLYEEIKTTNDNFLLDKLSTRYKKLYPNKLVSTSSVSAQTTIPCGDIPE
jgi:hypothetical protein